jgi:hypothetical protein
MKDGLDQRAYNFALIDACKAPIWRTWKCPAHEGYDDIVAVMLPLGDRNEDRLRCGCMKPYNESATQFTQERRISNA